MTTIYKCCFFILRKTNEILGRQIRLCQKQYPQSEARTITDFDLDLLTNDDKCYLHCIMTAQKLAWYFIRCTEFKKTKRFFFLYFFFYRFWTDLSTLTRWNSHRVIQRLHRSSEVNADIFVTMTNVNLLLNCKNALKSWSEKLLHHIFLQVKLIT